MDRIYLQVIAESIVDSPKAARHPVTREEVLEKCYTAKKAEEIKAAWLARGGWLRTHPDDDEVLDLGEMLSKLEDSFRPKGVDLAFGGRANASLIDNVRK